MSELFLEIFNMSVAASYLIIAVLLLRLALKKAPKWISVALFAVAAIRLVCPFSIESVLSLIPSAQTVSPEIMINASPEINSGIPIIDDSLNPIIAETFKPVAENSINPMETVVTVAAFVWLAGAIVLIAYASYSYLRIKRRMATAIISYDNVYKSENADSPFVLGFIKPRIYLPFMLDPIDEEYVVAHEKAHIRRRDYLWKPLGYFLLIIHWFNPFVWVGYIFLCRDIESACDEKVVKELSREERARYSEALLACSVNRRLIAACPVAFGEQGVKERIKTVLNYKKPSFWIIAVSIIATLALSVFFLTDPVIDDGIIKADSGNLLYLGTGEITEQTYNDAAARYESGGYTPIVSSKISDRVSIKTDFKIRSVDANGPSMVVNGYNEHNLRTLLSVQAEKGRREALIDIGWWHEYEKSDFDSGIWSYFVRVEDENGTVHNYYFRVKYGESVGNYKASVEKSHLLYAGKGEMSEYDFTSAVHMYIGQLENLTWSKNEGVLVETGFKIRSVKAKVFSPGALEDFSSNAHYGYFEAPTVYGETSALVDVGWVYRVGEDEQIANHWSYLVSVTDENDEIHNYYFRVTYNMNV